VRTAREQPVSDVTPGTKRCTQCGDEIAVDALFCSHCGQSQVGAGGDPLLGKVVAGLYLVQELLGGGASGNVYRVRHTRLQQALALKVLHAHLGQDAAAVERFHREATTVAEIDNEHIIQVRDFGRAEDGRPFIAMELLEGETLASLVGRAAPLPYDQALDLFSQAASALIEAHAVGYVHRDLRPRNLFLAHRRGRSDFVKLLDFGLSKLASPELDPGQSTTSLGLGDPTYLSPEQIRGEAADRRSDQYSLTVILYELLTGRPPFAGRSRFAVLDAHLSEAPEAPSRRNPAVPAALDAPLLRALSKARDDRFTTLVPMLDALQGALAQVAPSRPGSRRREDETQPAVPRRMASSEAPASDPCVAAAAPAPVAPAAPASPVPEAVSLVVAVTDAASEAAPASVSLSASASASASAVESPAPGPTTALPERPDGSGPHPIPPSVPPAGPPAADPPEAPAVDPTMSQMWYAAGEAEAQRQLEEYREATGRAAESTLEVPAQTEVRLAVADRRRWRTLLVVGSLLVAAGVVLVLLLRTRTPARDRPGPSPTHDAGVASVLDATPPPRDAGVADAAPGALAPVDAGGAVNVVDRETVIDGDPVTRPDAGVRSGPPRPGPMDPGGAVVSEAAVGEAVSAGRSALSRGDAAGAREQFQRALALRPGYGPALLGLGEALFEAGQHGAAIAHLRKATRALPGQVRAWVLLGNACFRAGQNAEARSAYRTALRLQPGHAEATRNLGIVEQRLGPRP
jgi:serine/threonine-protein kinase